jgi:nicotinamide mononucleotide transporter
MLDSLVSALAEMAWLEFSGLLSGLLCVWLLIRQNVWTFPIGLIYAVVSVVVFTQQRLYADVLLSGYYVLMNGYGWYYWLKGGIRSPDDELPVTHIDPRTLLWLAALTGLSTLAMGWFFATQTNADLPFWDSFTTCASFAAMWMTARKYLENWMVWLVVDVVASVIYLVKGIEFYAVLYFVYLGMAIMGFLAWRQSMSTPQTSPSA